MSYPNISYQSFCWSLGTTSFRTKNFNYQIETQLKLLDEFWKGFANPRVAWSDGTQSEYYDFLKSNDFLIGSITSASKKAKDARQKTSGLVDIGLITDTRRLTEAGEALLAISNSNDFTPDNFFGIDKDSFIFLKQLLKTSSAINSQLTVKPLVVLIYLLSKVGTLSKDEFTYLLPLCIDENSTALVLTSLLDIRNEKLSTDDVIIRVLLAMSNYEDAKKLLLANKASEELVCAVGFNRKSRDYDKSYFPLYEALKDVFLKKKQSAHILFDCCTKITIGSYWKNLLFKDNTRKKILANQLDSLNNTNFSTITDEAELKSVFFDYLHLFKAKATLSDYADLNTRYLKTTGIFLFEDSTIRLDIIPEYFFSDKIDTLYKKAFIIDDKLEKNIDLEKIDACLKVDNKAIIKAVKDKFGIDVSSVSAANKIIDDERYKRLNALIDNKFSDSTLLKLLSHFENRADKEIFELVTDNADVPTIFEYILAIIWYKISDRQGKLLDYMKLSLEADLLPKSHAGGGDADIVYEYEKSASYPKHSLLLEATLANASGQRSMEMEPVSRHLGQHILKTSNKDSYCVFTSTFLNINVISDFRSRKTTTWYDTQDHSKFIEGMKIIPLDTKVLRHIIEKDYKYADLYKIFEEAFKSELPPHEWYENCIANAID